MGNLKSGVYSKEQKRVRIRPIKHAKMANFFSVKLYKMAQKIADFVEGEYDAKGRDSLKELIASILTFDKITGTWLKVTQRKKSFDEGRRAENEPSLRDLLLNKDNDDDDK